MMHVYVLLVLALDALEIGLSASFFYFIRKTNLQQYRARTIFFSQELSWVTSVWPSRCSNISWSKVRVCLGTRLQLLYIVWILYNQIS